METSTNIYSSVIYAKRLGVFLFVYILGGMALSAYFGGLVRSAAIVIIGFAIFVVIPIIFRKTFQSRFEKKSSFSFKNEFLLVEIFSNDTKQLERKCQLLYKDIQSCLVSSSSMKTSTITIRLTSTTTFQYSFLSNSDEAVTTNQFDNNIAFKVFRNLRVFNNKIILEGVRELQ